MGMLITCTKGCGEAIEVTDEMVEEAKRANSPINVAHEICPNEPGAPMRKFKVTVVVSEVHEEDEQEPAEEQVAGMGAEVEAGSFKLALDKLQEQLNTQWGRIVGMADVVDARQYDPPQQPVTAGQKRVVDEA